MSVLYDKIGVTYSHTRAADPRIVAGLIDLLGLPAGAHLIDSGAWHTRYGHVLTQDVYDRGYLFLRLKRTA